MRRRRIFGEVEGIEGEEEKRERENERLRGAWTDLGIFLLIFLARFVESHLSIFNAIMSRRV